MRCLGGGQRGNLQFLESNMVWCAARTATIVCLSLSLSVCGYIYRFVYIRRLDSLSIYLYLFRRWGALKPVWWRIKAVKSWSSNCLWNSDPVFICYGICFICSCIMYVYFSLCSYRRTLLSQYRSDFPSSIKELAVFIDLAPRFQLMAEEILQRQIQLVIYNLKEVYLVTYNQHVMLFNPDIHLLLL